MYNICIFILQFIKMVDNNYVKLSRTIINHKIFIYLCEKYTRKKF